MAAVVSPVVFDEKRVDCIACGSSSIASWARKRQGGVEYQIACCESCETGFMNPRPAISFLKNSIYSTSGHGLASPVSLSELLRGEREYPNATRDASTLVKVALEKLDSRGRALDIGSGYGFYSKAARDAGFQVVAVNPGRWENEVFEELNGSRPIESFFEEVQLAGRFKLVIVSQVLEHIHDPVSFLRKAAASVERDGIIAIAVPNFRWVLVSLLRERETGVLWVPEHLNYFTVSGLSKLLERCNLEVLRVQQVARIPYNAISRRLGLKGTPRKIMNRLFQGAQWLPMRAAELSGRGITLQVWAKPRSE